MGIVESGGTMCSVVPLICVHLCLSAAIQNLTSECFACRETAAGEFDEGVLSRR